MAREYGSRRSARRGGNSLPQQVLVMIVTFVLGYFTASIFDINALSHWMTTQILENHEPPQNLVKAQSKKEQVLPKQKFEFYTLLANEKGVGASQVTVNNNSSSAISTSANAAAVAAQGTVGARNPQMTHPTITSAATTRVAANQSAQIKPANVLTARPITSSSSRSNNYVVQVASFKARNDAEHMKGLLILKGFEVSVVSVTTPNQGNWFRVLIGPYPNRTLAQKAQVILAKTQRLNGMVRTAT